MQIKIGSVVSLALVAASLISTQAFAATNRAPVISGTPAAKATAGVQYNFQPAASDADGNKLVFSVTGKPSWVTFHSTTGRFHGTPTNAEAGVYEDIQISVSDGKLTKKLPMFSITVATDKKGRAPTITGTPAANAPTGARYNFQPGALDADGDKLVFSITGKPSWVTFHSTTGRFHGTPTAADAGVYKNIQITVSDGKQQTNLAPFSITVSAPVAKAPVAKTHELTISWEAPLVNTDGSTLTDLSGYRIVYGSTSGQYTKTVEVNTAGLTRYMLENLPSGKYFIAVKAKNSKGVESDVSPEASVDLT
jgi:Putative Ig domain